MHFFCSMNDNTNIVTLEVAGNPLSESDKASYSRLNEKIAKGLRAALEAGKALNEVKERKLYKVEYGTWEEYLESRHSMSKSYASRIIRAAAIVLELEKRLPIGNFSVLPTSESQVRELLRLRSGEERVEAWTKAVNACDGKVPTAMEVERQVVAIRSRSATVEETEPNAGASSPARQATFTVEVEAVEVADTAPDDGVVGEERDVSFEEASDQDDDDLEEDEMEEDDIDEEDPEEEDIVKDDPEEEDLEEDREFCQDEVPDDGDVLEVLADPPSGRSLTPGSPRRESMVVAELETQSAVLHDGSEDPDALWVGGYIDHKLAQQKLDEIAKWSPKDDTLAPEERTALQRFFIGFVELANRLHDEHPTKTMRNGVRWIFENLLRNLVLVAAKPGDVEGSPKQEE